MVSRSAPLPRLDINGRAFVYVEAGKLLYIVYLDEFGHIGPYLSSTDKSHKTHPVFGLGGVVLPYTEVRKFSTYFYQLKNRLLDYELKNSGIHPAKWEKKGASLYTVTNVTKY